MGSKDNPCQASGQSDDRSATFYYDFHKGDTGHTVLLGSTRQGKCVQGVTGMAANNEAATTIRLPAAGIRGETK